MKPDQVRFGTLAAITHRGAVRGANEDAVAIGKDVLTGNMDEPTVTSLYGFNHIFMVADGMGGHTHGAVASRAALDAVIRFGIDLSNIDACADALVDANDRIYDLMGDQPETAGMGTTIVGVAISDDAVVHFNVGDSRAYRHRTGSLVCLTSDDTLHVTRQGQSRVSHLITQSLGGRRSRTRIRPHIGVSPALLQDETVLICSDGLTDMVSDDMILEILDNIFNPSECIKKLFSCAIEAGGRDNISIVIARRALYY